jgi:hypothetical protein
MDSTMTIRVNEVARINTDGASESTVMSTSNCTPDVTCFGAGDCESTVKETPGAAAHPLNNMPKRRIITTKTKVLLNGLPHRLALVLDIFGLTLENILSTMIGLYSFPFKFSLDKLKDLINEPKSKPG